VRNSIKALTAAIAAGVVVTALASPVSAQEPLAEPPSGPAFMSRYQFELSAAALAEQDPRFTWDTHWAGNFDLIDYVFGRAMFLADYEAMLGNEFRPFDPYQSNYTLEASASGRTRSVEIALVLNHVSRHLGDRPKRLAIAMNSLGARVMRRFVNGPQTVDLRLDLRKIIEHAYVDYTWVGDADVAVRRDLGGRLGVYGRGIVTFYPVDQEIAGRNRQTGGRVEAGIQIRGAAGAIQLFGGWERLVDADPLDRLAQQWAFAGFRIVGR
jgi:hypothetical protein